MLNAWMVCISSAITPLTICCLSSSGTAKAGHLFAFRDANPCYTFNSKFLQTAADFQFAQDLDWLASAAKSKSKQQAKRR